MVPTHGHEILTGNTSECIAHFVKKSHGEHAAIRVYQKWSEGAPTETADKIPTLRQWFAHGRLPVGEQRIRLQTFLEDQGYQIIETQGLSPEVRLIRRAIVDRKITPEEVSEKIGYVKPSWVYQMLTGQSIPNGQFGERMTRLVHELKRGTPNTAKTLKVIPKSEVPSEACVSRDVTLTRNVFIESIAHSIKMLLPLANFAASDNFSAREREKIRELVGTNGVFNLKNALTALCGETARKSINQNASISTSKGSPK